MGNGEGEGGRSARRWPIWVAGSLAVVSLVAAVFTWVAAIGAGNDADDAEAAVVAAEQETADVADGLGSVDEGIEIAEGQAVVLEAMFESGMAQALGGVYLRAITTGCQQGPGTDTDDLIRQVSAGELTPTLAAHDGWDAAIDHAAIDAAVARCGDDDG